MPLRTTLPGRSLLAAERASWGTQNQSLQVLIDGQVVSTITPTSTTYQTYTTAAFTATAGVHKITFQGMNASGDASSLIDSVKVAVAQVAAPTAPTVANAGFEFQTSYTGSGDYLAYRFNPTGSAWTFNGLAGVSANTPPSPAATPTPPKDRRSASSRTRAASRKPSATGPPGRTKSRRPGARFGTTRRSSC